MKRPRVTFAYLYSEEGMSFGLMYLSAVLKARGYQVNLIQAKDSADLIRKFSRNPSEIAAFSVTTGLHKYYLA